MHSHAVGVSKLLWWFCDRKPGTVCKVLYFAETHCSGKKVEMNTFGFTPAYSSERLLEFSLFDVCDLTFLIVTSMLCKLRFHVCCDVKAMTFCGLLYLVG